MTVHSRFGQSVFLFEVNGLGKYEGGEMQWAFDVVAAVFDRASRVLMSPFDPSNRIYWLYLVSSAIAAFFVYGRIKARGEHATATDAEAASGSFLQFLFPKSVWKHPSAWLDLRYVFFHKIAEHFLLLGVMSFATALGYYFTSGGQSVTDMAEQEQLRTTGGWLLGCVYMLVTLFLLDFVSWFIHLLQHKIPVLWQFHKVHHSAEVMHPISNFREHPVDNLCYLAALGFTIGVLYAIAVRFLGFRPTMPEFFGIPILMFLFNFTAYNLRHSHVWLRWPGIWSVVFPSPAHHHVHHSCHPNHIDKNFAFMFPVWDLIFGTYFMPDDNRDVKFGVTEGDGEDLDGVLKLYWVPFRDVFRLFTAKKDVSASGSLKGEKESGKPEDIS